MGRLLPLAATAAIATLLVAAHLAAAASTDGGPTRSEYVTKLEALCRPDSEATERAMRGVRDDVSDGRTDLAARKFAKGARIFGGTVKAMTPVARPAADVERLRKWFVYLNRQEKYLGQVTTRLEAERVIEAQRAIARFIHNGNLANNAVLAFGFDYCDFRFSRYG